MSVAPMDMDLLGLGMRRPNSSTRGAAPRRPR